MAQLASNIVPGHHEDQQAVTGNKNTTPPIRSTSALRARREIRGKKYPRAHDRRALQGEANAEHK